MTTTTPRRPTATGGSGASEVHPKVRARRVAVARAAGRRRLRWLIAIVAVLTLVVAAWGVTRSEVFDVDRIEVVGAAATDPAEVVAVAGVGMGTPMLDVHADPAARAVVELPAVVSATVEREWPGTVRITIRERVAVAALRVVDPAAAATDGGRVALVDVDGWIIDVVDGPAPAGLASVSAAVSVGLGPGEAVDPWLRPSLVLAARVPDALGATDVDVRTVDGDLVVDVVVPRSTGGPATLAIRLGDLDDLDAKLVAAATVLDSATDDDLVAVTELDVRVPGAVVPVREGSPQAEGPES